MGALSRNSWPKKGLGVDCRPHGEGEDLPAAAGFDLRGVHGASPAYVGIGPTIGKG